MANTGRKSKPYRTADGQYINGLTRDPKSLRWRIIGTMQTFREADEQKAIERYYRIIGKTPDVMPYQTDPHSDLASERHNSGVHFHSWQQVYQHVAKEILGAPQLAAERLGIEWIAYGNKLSPPEPLPTFADLEQVWKDRFKKTGGEKVLAAWKDFVKTTGIKGIADITETTAVAFREAVFKRVTAEGVPLSPKYQKNIFDRIKQFLSFARKQAIARKQLADCLLHLELLTPSDDIIDAEPNPIERAEFEKLLTAAKGHAANTAMLLLMLNGGYLSQEVIRLKWEHVRSDGCIVTHRYKKGKRIRVCILWQETRDALAKLPKQGDYIFINEQGKPLGLKGAESRFRALKEKAKVKSSPKQLRSGANTAAAQGGADDRTCRILMGHSCGISDKYILRNPQMVAPACAAVYDFYFGKEKKAVAVAA